MTYRIIAWIAAMLLATFVGLWFAGLLPASVDGEVIKLCTHEGQTNCFKAAGNVALEPFRRKDDADAYIALFTVILSVATVVLACSTIGLWLATKKMWRAGERQLALTKDALDHSRDTAKRQLRAYVTTTDHKAYDYKLLPDNVVSPCFDLQNRGQTPATNVQVTINASYVASDEADTAELEWSPGTAFTLAPGERTTIAAVLPPLTEEMMAQLTARTHGILLLGKATYDDAFGQQQWVRTRSSSFDVNKVGRDGTLQLEWFGDDNDAS